MAIMLPRSSLPRARRAGHLPLAAMASLALFASGCDTLKARSLAQDGVDKYRNGDVKGAADLFEQAARIEPDMPVIQINRGYTHLALFQLSPKSKEGAAAATTAVDAFKRYLNLKVSAEQRSKARDYLLQTFSDAQKYDEAVEFFKPQVERTPPDLEALTILGNIAKSVGKMDAARSWLEKRIAANPKDADGYVALAIMDWDLLCADSSCRMPPDKKLPPKMAPEERLNVANRGIDNVKKAADLAPNAPTPLTYWNLLLRERQYAYVPATIDPKDKQFQQKMDAETERINKLKTDDLTLAAELMTKAMAMQKAATGASAKPPEPPKPGAEPAKPPEPGKPPAPPAPAGTPPTPPAAPEKK